DPMIEFKEAVVTAEKADTYAVIKVHQLARTGSLELVYGSFLGAANTVKALRAIVHTGGSLRFGDDRLTPYRPANPETTAGETLIRASGLGDGYVHCIFE